MIPDILQIVSYSYNEVALDRKGSDNESFDHRIQPSCVICFDGIIDEDSKRAAQYFDIPIYNINRQKYKERNEKIRERYEQGSITSFGIDDVHKILYSKKSMTDSYNLVLSLADKVLAKGMIDENECIDILKETRSIIAKYSGHNYIKEIDLKEIEKRLNVIGGVDKTKEDKKSWKKN